MEDVHALERGALCASHGRCVTWKVCHMEGVSHGRCGIWKVWHMEGVAYGRCGTWKVWHMEGVSHGRCGIWKVSYTRCHTRCHTYSSGQKKVSVTLPHRAVQPHGHVSALRVHVYKLKHSNYGHSGFIGASNIDYGVLILITVIQRFGTV